MCLHVMVQIKRSNIFAFDFLSVFNLHTVLWGLYFLQFRSLNSIELGTGKFEETEKFIDYFDQK
jgi:hypothetical protein